MPSVVVAVTLTIGCEAVPSAFPVVVAPRLDVRQGGRDGRRASSIGMLVVLRAAMRRSAGFA
jgi:hypothetical protein